MALWQKPRFFDETRKVFYKLRSGTFFDRSTGFADGQNRRLVRVAALASDVGLEGFDPMNLSGLSERRKRVVNSRWRDFWIGRL